MIGSASFVLLGSPALPANNLVELVAYAKANPNKLNLASTGSPTLSYLLGLQFKLLTGTQMADVAYKGSAQIYPDLMSNQVSLYFDNPGASTPLVNSGRLKAFGVSSPTPAQNILKPPPVPVDSTTGVFMPMALAKFSATAVVKG